MRLSEITAFIRAHSGVTGKKAISGANRFIRKDDPLHGPGDDGAVVEMGGANVVGCGEAISPPFFRSDPYGSGIAAVLANVNDVAAMGGIPTGIVNTVIGPREHTDEALRGIADAADMYDIPVIGGHLTECSESYALSAFAMGLAEKPLSMANVASGQALLFVACLNGRMRDDFPFFTTLEKQRSTLGRDVRLFATAAARGLALSAKDVSMAGILGSLAMLLEFRKLGAVVDLDKLPTPAGVDRNRWLISFPTFAFWMTAEQETVPECIRLFEEHDLVCSHVGDVSQGSELILQQSGESHPLMDFATESITGLWD